MQSHPVSFKQIPAMMTWIEFHIFINDTPESQIRSSYLKIYDEWIEERFSQFLEIDQNDTHPYLSAFKKLPYPKDANDIPVPGYYDLTKSSGSYQGADDIYFIARSLYRAGFKHLTGKRAGLVYMSDILRQLNQHHS